MTAKEIVGISVLSTAAAVIGFLIVDKIRDFTPTAVDPDQPVLMVGGSLHLFSGTWTPVVPADPNDQNDPVVRFRPYEYASANPVRRIEWTCDEQNAFTSERLTESGGGFQAFSIVIEYNSGSTAAGPHRFEFSAGTGNAKMRLQVSKRISGENDPLQINPISRLYLQHLFATGQYPITGWKAWKMTSTGLNPNINPEGGPMNCSFPEAGTGFFILNFHIRP